MRPKLLVVDDDRPAVESFAAMLECMGYEVTIAYDGGQGLQKTQETRPDVVIMDIDMPVMDGFETASALRETANPCPPIVALSGLDEAAFSKRNEGRFDLRLAKPVCLGQMADVIEKLVNCRV